MADNKKGLRVSPVAKLKSFTTAKDDLKGSIDKNCSNKKAKTGNENVLLYPNSAYSPEDSVFSIDHILESIFAELDRKSLLHSRLVSRRWVYFSSIALQKIITLKFEHFFKNESNSTQVLLCDGHKDRPIKDLVTLINDSTNFPCRSFVFVNHCFENSDSLAQRFFNAHGTFIKKLRFEGFLLLSELKRLLLSQAPNLEQLVLNDVDFTRTESESRLNKSVTPEEGRRRRDSLFKETAIGPGLNKTVLKNLKVFTCDATVPGIFLQQLLDCSPNLVEVFVELEFLHHLVQRVNRLHLLKKLKVQIGEDTIQSLKILANNGHLDNWAVREIQFLNYDVYGEPVLALQAAEAFSKILKGCSKTCHTLLWNDHFENFVIPPMPGVRHFSFEYSEDQETGLPVNLFPEGVSLEDTFPKLTSLEISSHYEMENLPIENIFGDDDPVPLPGVKKVFLRFHAGQDLLQSFQEMFPNATITETEAGSESDDDDVASCSVM